MSTPNGTLTFEPLDTDANPLELRFAFSHAGLTFRGSLRLKRPGDPLSLRVIDAATETLLGEAWAAALIVYAELTCTDPPERTDPAATSRTRSTDPAIRGGDGPPAIRTLQTPVPGPRALGRDAAGSGARAAMVDLSFVAGHLRRLTADQTASAGAERAAARAGINVPAGYTWVRPHNRGASTCYEFAGRTLRVCGRGNSRGTFGAFARPARRWRAPATPARLPDRRSRCVASDVWQRELGDDA